MITKRIKRNMLIVKIRMNGISYNYQAYIGRDRDSLAATTIHSMYMASLYLKIKSGLNELRQR